MQTDLTHPERRSTVRHKVALAVEMETGAGVTRDFSRGGLYLLTRRPLAVGQVLQLRVAVPDRGRSTSFRLACSGLVVRVEETRGTVGAGITLAEESMSSGVVVLYEKEARRSHNELTVLEDSDRSHEETRKANQRPIGRMATGGSSRRSHREVFNSLGGSLMKRRILLTLVLGAVLVLAASTVGAAAPSGGANDNPTGIYHSGNLDAYPLIDPYGSFHSDEVHAIQAGTTPWQNYGECLQARKAALGFKQ
jgi:hypothetical protein